jgi:hypothetical protein
MVANDCHEVIRRQLARMFPIFVGILCELLNSSLSTKLKVKAIPLQAWTGPEDSRRLRLPDFKTIGT